MVEEAKISKAQQRAVNKYVKNNYDRINVTFPKGKRAMLKDYADKHGESVNSFIVRAVNEIMERDSFGPAATCPALQSPTKNVTESMKSVAEPRKNVSKPPESIPEPNQYPQERRC